MKKTNRKVRAITADVRLWAALDVAAEREMLTASQLVDALIKDYLRNKYPDILTNKETNQ